MGSTIASPASAARQRGKNRALVAVARSVLVIACHILKDKRHQSELGTGYFETLDPARLQHHRVPRLEHLGFAVTFTPKEVA